MLIIRYFPFIGTMHTDVCMGCSTRHAQTLVLDKLRLKDLGGLDKKSWTANTPTKRLHAFSDYRISKWSTLGDRAGRTTACWQRRPPPWAASARWPGVKKASRRPKAYTPLLQVRDGLLNPTPTPRGVTKLPECSATSLIAVLGFHSAVEEGVGGFREPRACRRRGGPKRRSLRA